MLIERHVNQPGMWGPPGVAAALRGAGRRFRRFSSSNPLDTEFKGQPGLRDTLSQINKQNVQRIWQGQPNAYRDFPDARCGYHMKLLREVPDQAKFEAIFQVVFNPMVARAQRWQAHISAFHRLDESKIVDRPVREPLHWTGQAELSPPGRMWLTCSSQEPLHVALGCLFGQRLLSSDLQENLSHHHK